MKSQKMASMTFYPETFFEAITFQDRLEFFSFYCILLVQLKQVLSQILEPTAPGLVEVRFMPMNSSNSLIMEGKVPVHKERYDC